MATPCLAYFVKAVAVDDLETQGTGLSQQRRDRLCYPKNIPNSVWKLNVVLILESNAAVVFQLNKCLLQPIIKKKKKTGFTGCFELVFCVLLNYFHELAMLYRKMVFSPSWSFLTKCAIVNTYLRSGSEKQTNHYTLRSLHTVPV